MGTTQLLHARYSSCHESYLQSTLKVPQHTVAIDSGTALSGRSHQDLNKLMSVLELGSRGNKDLEQITFHPATGSVKVVATHVDFSVRLRGIPVTN